MPSLLAAIWVLSSGYCLVALLLRPDVSIAGKLLNSLLVALPFIGPCYYFINFHGPSVQSEELRAKETDGV